MAEFMSLPQEVQIETLLFLGIKDLLHVAATCKTLHNLLSTSLDLQHHLLLLTTGLTISPFARSSSAVPLLHRVRRLRARESRLSSLNWTSEHVLVRGPASRAVAAGTLAPLAAGVRRDPYSSLRVLRDGWFILGGERVGVTGKADFELWKLPSAREDGEGEEQGQAEEGEGEKAKIKPVQAVATLSLGPGKAVKDFDLDGASDLLVASEIQLQHSPPSVQLTFHFLSLSLSVSSQCATQHPTAPSPFTHDLLRLRGLNLQMMLQEDYLAVQVFAPVCDLPDGGINDDAAENMERDVVVVFNWRENMRVEAVIAPTDRCIESFAFILPNVLVVATTSLSQRSPAIDIYELTPSPSVAAMYAPGFSTAVDPPPPQRLSTAGARLLKRYLLPEIQSHYISRIPFVFSEPILTRSSASHALSPELPSPESGSVCLEVKLDMPGPRLLPEDLPSATIVCLKKRLLEGLPIGEGMEVDVQGEKDVEVPWEDWGETGTRVLDDSRASIYPMYAHRLAQVTDDNFIQLLDFNPTALHLRPSIPSAPAPSRSPSPTSTPGPSPPRPMPGGLTIFDELSSFSPSPSSTSPSLELYGEGEDEDEDDESDWVSTSSTASPSFHPPTVPRNAAYAAPHQVYSELVLPAEDPASADTVRGPFAEEVRGELGYRMVARETALGVTGVMIDGERAVVETRDGVFRVLVF